MMTVDMFKGFPQLGDHYALITADGGITYADLETRITEFANRFQAERGLFLLGCNNTPETIVAYLAALRVGCPVFLADIAQLSTVSSDAQFTFKYIYDPAHDDFTAITNTKSPQPHPDLAVVMSTSGTTGSAKSVQLSRKNIETNARTIAEYLALTPTDRAPTILPLYYSYGLSVLNSHLTAGGSVLLTDQSVTESGFWESFKKYHCTSFSGVPHTYDLIEKSGVQTKHLPHLRYATQAGGKLDPEKVSELAARSTEEGWRFFIMYGQTEASPRMAFLPPEAALSQPHCIGRPISGGAFRLEDEQGREIIEPEKGGELIYTGPNVMMGYAANDHDLTIGSTLSELRTGDLARKTNDDFYYIVGRKNRFIKPFGLRISLDEVETRLTRLGYDVAAIGIDETLWVATSSAMNDAAILEDLSDWLKLPKKSIRITHLPVLLRSENGKTDYTAIKQSIVAKSISHEPNNEVSVTELFRKFIGATTRKNRTPDTVRQVFSRHFPDIAVQDSDSFAGLGGDSLSYIDMMLELENIVGDLPNGWENKTLRELSAKPKKTLPTIEADILLRFLSILLIVSSHFGALAYGGGGAFLLLMITGFNFSRFQLPESVSNGPGKPISSLFLKIAAPTILYLLLLQAVFQSFSWSTLALISNFIEPQANQGFSYWFIEVYLQILVIVGILLMAKPMRKSFGEHTFSTSIGLTAASIAALFIGPMLWDTEPLRDNVPHMLLWLFACGAAAQSAKTSTHRIIVTVLFLMALAIHAKGVPPISFLFLGGILLIWTPKIPFPPFLKKPAYAFAGATLFIYLTHFQFASLAEKLIGDNKAVSIAFALVGGALIWTIYTRVVRYFSEKLRFAPARMKP